MVSQCALKLQGSVYVPQSVDTSIVALQLVYDIEILYPMLISIDASNVCIRPALMANLSLQQAVVYGVLHLGGRRSFVKRLWRAPEMAYESSGEANGQASRVGAQEVQRGCDQSGGNFSTFGLA